MKTQTVKFIKYHTSFAHDVDELAELPEDEAKRAIDAGLAVAATKAEKADADPKAAKAVVPTASDKAAKAAAEQRDQMHGKGDTAIVASGNELGTAVVMPVATTADGTKVLGKPADEALTDSK